MNTTKHTEAWAALAQGVLNIDAGHEIVMAGSRVHEGMKAIIANPVYEAAPELLSELIGAREIVARAASVESCKWTTDLDKIAEHVRKVTSSIDAVIAKATNPTL